MIDAVGAPSSVLVLGGTSEIGEAIVTELAAKGRLARVALAARPSARRDDVAARVRSLGVARVDAEDFDAIKTAGHGALVNRVFDDGDLDVVVVAAGILTEKDDALDDPSVAVRDRDGQLRRAHVGDPARGTPDARRRVTAYCVVLSSVAGERPRRANFVYGSTKAGLDAFATGLGDDLHGSGVSVLVVRPASSPAA